jgi:hypothetical protein
MNSLVAALTALALAAPHDATAPHDAPTAPSPPAATDCEVQRAALFDALSYSVAQRGVLTARLREAQTASTAWHRLAEVRAARIIDCEVEVTALRETAADDRDSGWLQVVLAGAVGLALGVALGVALD